MPDLMEGRRKSSCRARTEASNGQDQLAKLSGVDPGVSSTSRRRAVVGQDGHHSAGCEPVNVRIAPSILSNFCRTREDIRKVEQAGAHLLHVDVMDGHFVPNITIGPPVVKSIRAATKLPLDVHLMISDPDKYIPAFVDAGANMLTVHAEATVHLDRTLNFIRSHNVGVGVSINPATPVSLIEHALGLADMLLIRVRIRIWRSEIHPIYSRQDSAGEAAY